MKDKEFVAVKEFLHRDFSTEFEFGFSRSSGPGGQHVNRTESRVELIFDVDGSCLLTENEKELIRLKLSNRINQDGKLILFCQERRSQLKNKELVVQRFYMLVGNALRKRKKRIPTSPSKSSIEKRIEIKKKISEKKKLRGKTDIN